jgi:hypothetical protein
MAALCGLTLFPWLLVRWAALSIFLLHSCSLSWEMNIRILCPFFYWIVFLLICKNSLPTLDIHLLLGMYVLWLIVLIFYSHLKNTDLLHFMQIWMYYKYLLISLILILFLLSHYCWGGKLWHLQKFLQNIIVKFTPSIILLYSLSPFLE